MAISWPARPPRASGLIADRAPRWASRSAPPGPVRMALPRL